MYKREKDAPVVEKSTTYHTNTFYMTIITVFDFYEVGIIAAQRQGDSHLDCHSHCPTACIRPTS